MTGGGVIGMEGGNGGGRWWCERVWRGSVAVGGCVEREEHKFSHKLVEKRERKG